MQSLIAQIIGFIGTGVFISSFQCKSARKLLWIQVSSNAIYILHFCILGVYTAAIIQIILIANYICVNLSADGEHITLGWNGWKWVYSICILLTTAATWLGPIDIFACIASVVTILCSWTRNGKKIRMARLFCIAPFWLIYDVIRHSYSGAAAQLIGIISVLVSARRYGWKALDQEN